MAIFDDVSEQMKEALRAKDRQRLGALRLIRAAFLNRMKEDNSDSVADPECITLLRRLEKQRKESIEAFVGAGRSEQAEAERAELEVIEAFLPRLADASKTREWVSEAIVASGAAGAKDVGKVMGALMKAHKGNVDGGLARQIAVEELTD